MLSAEPRPILGILSGLIAVSLAVSPTISAPVSAQEATGAAPTSVEATSDAEASFLSEVEEARDAAQATIEGAIATIDDACIGRAVEECLSEVVAVHLPLVSDEYEAYADTLEAAAAPEAFADDVERHVEMLRSTSELLDQVVAAAEAGEVGPIPDLADRIAAAHAGLAEGLDPAYGRAAFVSPFVGLPNTPFQRIDFVVLMGSTEEEQAYLDAVAEVTQRLVVREGCYGRALTGPAETDADRLERLTACGAGETYESMLEAARLLEPPPRFADEHAWWLTTLEASALHDRASGEAARAGDLAGFLAATIRLGLATGPYVGLDPAFGTASQPPGSRLGSAPDLTAAVSRSPYGQALFTGLVAYWVSDPRFHGALPLEFPSLPPEATLAAIASAGPDLLAAADELSAAIAELQPPAELAADHDLILGFFGRERDRLVTLLDAAEAGDVSAARGAWEGGFEDYCATVAGLSEAIRPVTDVFFAGQGCP